RSLRPTGHNYGDWITDEEPTCGEEGLRHHTCLTCKTDVEEVIPATGNHTDADDDGICDDCGQTVSIIGNLEDIGEADFSIHFLELGNRYAGDSLLIKCGDTEVLIDAGSRQASASTIKEYVDDYCEDGILEYVIATHADQDHISGFVGLAGNPRTGILYQYEIGTIIMFDNVKPDKEDGALYNNFLSAVDYAKENGANVYTASQCYDMTDGAQRQYYLDEAQTLSINILYNYYYYNVDRNDENNHSVVTLLTQEKSDGNKYYLFTGDLEEDGESRMVDHYSVASNSRSEYDILPEVELYKAGHHGSKTSSTEKLLSVIKPKYVTVCCCAGSPEYTKTDENTFPTQIMIDNVSKYTDQIYVTTLATDLPEVTNGTFASQSGYNYTSMNGNIVFYCKGGTLKLYCSNNYTLLKDTDWFKEHRTWNAG
ncbi:MAG: MBL fold metallo-hydrolase, partial [Clostridia bacterium]|nr:MBL fold metallo-hydrolase [Clostridia bacterium]